jgi:regulatory protein
VSKTGPPVPPEDVQDAPGDPESVARAICLRLLTQRARSRAELTDALRRRGVPDDAADRVLTRFTEVGLIDDESLAHSVASAQHRDRGLAARAVAAKLRQRGLSEQDVSSAVASIDSESEHDAARRLVARRLPALRGLPEETKARRLVGFLARRGYAANTAVEVVREALHDGIAGDMADDSGTL